MKVRFKVSGLVAIKYGREGNVNVEKGQIMDVSDKETVTIWISDNICEYVAEEAKVEADKPEPAKYEAKKEAHKYKK